ncbi:stage II sporulation protein P [Niallia circulans]|uniref:Stage II sporulation protein P n=1 Tax=Niallia circulans TaxID=1397 RepID=A0A941JNT2_NIACI|nr:stage II sporulation protein P [Niallia circulans]MCB5238546.1 stage II sporulation protein P [Niallia circulans]
MNNSKSRSLIRYLHITILGIILVFILIALITTSFFSFKLTSNNVANLLNDINSTEFYLEFIHSENHLFPPSEAREFSLSNFFLPLSSNIHFDDIRTLLGRELPALAFFHTEIVVAEEGTTIADLPFESIPSKEMLENPVEVDEEKAKQEQKEEQPTKEDRNRAITKPKNKTVFIYNSHNFEAYLPLLKNTKNNDNVVSADERANVVGVSSKLSELLQQEGLGVELDKTNINQVILDRKWDYTYSYTVSKEVVETAINNNGNLKYLIDIHRDSARKKQTTANINGKNYAKLLFIIGKENKNYEQNEQFATKLHNALKKKYPGISKGVYAKGYELGNGVYNQNFSDRAILLEVGGVDNTNAELTRSIEAFADVYSKLYWEENQATQQ